MATSWQIAFKYIWIEEKNMKLLDTLLVVEPVIQAFERLGISYYIGGSVTSSFHGIPRATGDPETGVF